MEAIIISDIILGNTYPVVCLCNGSEVLCTNELLTISGIALFDMGLLMTWYW